MALYSIYAVPNLIASYNFWRINGYVRQGYIKVYDSSLRIPETKDSEYCKYISKISNRGYLTPSSGITILSKPKLSKYCDSSLYRLSSSQRTNLLYLKYKLFKNKIDYLVGTDILETKIIPKRLLRNPHPFDA